MNPLSQREQENQRAATLRVAHQIVWNYRAELEPYWPTPDPWDSLLFAQTELGEAIDAYLRSNTLYARNNDRSPDVLDELADCAMMLYTALGPDATRIQWWTPTTGAGEPVGDYTRWGTFCGTMGEIIDKAINFWDGGGTWIRLAVGLLHRIALYPEMDLPQRVADRLERIKAKRIPVDTRTLLDQAWPELPELEGVDVFPHFPVTGGENHGS